MIIDVKEFEFKDQRYFISEKPLNGKDRKIWTESTISPYKMKIVYKDSGVCRAEIPAEHARAFEAWVSETMSERCLIKKVFEYYPDGSLKRIYEIHGSDINDKIMIMLRWK